MKPPLYAYLVLGFGVLSLSTSAVFVKLADAPSAVTAFYRLLFAALALLPVVLLNPQRRRELRSLSKRQWALGGVSGLFLAAHYVLWFESLRYTSVASSTVIVTLQPLFSFAGGYFLFKERFGARVIAGCLAAIFGCFVIGWGDFGISGRALFGDLLAFLAAGIITGYFVIGQHVRKQLSAVSYSVLGYASSALVLAVYVLGRQVSFVHYPASAWGSFIGLALIATLAGQMSLNWLLKWLSAAVISMGILGETVGTCLLAYLILGEAVSLQQAFGIAIILAGLAVCLLRTRAVRLE